MHIIKISVKKEGYKFKGEWGGVYRRKERKGRDVIKV